MNGIILLCLANVNLFLHVTANAWFKNEDLLTPWDDFERELKNTFGAPQIKLRTT